MCQVFKPWFTINQKYRAQRVEGNYSRGLDKRQGCAKSRKPLRKNLFLSCQDEIGSLLLCKVMAMDSQGSHSGIKAFFFLFTSFFLVGQCCLSAIFEHQPTRMKHPLWERSTKIQLHKLSWEWYQKPKQFDFKHFLQKHQVQQSYGVHGMSKIVSFFFIFTVVFEFSQLIRA